MRASKFSSAVESGVAEGGYPLTVHSLDAPVAGNTSYFSSSAETCTHFSLDKHLLLNLLLLWPALEIPPFENEKLHMKGESRTPTQCLLLLQSACKNAQPLGHLIIVC